MEKNTFDPFIHYSLEGIAFKCAQHYNTNDIIERVTEQEDDGHFEKEIYKHYHKDRFKLGLPVSVIICKMVHLICKSIIE